MIQARHISSMPYPYLTHHQVHSGALKITLQSTGIYLIIGCHNTNANGVYTMSLFNGSTELTSTALSEVGQNNWRQGTLIHLIQATAGQEVSLKSGGSIISAQATGRSSLLVVRIG